METRAYAVKRYLHRLGHAQRSARFATSIGQLVAGLAPVMGWGRIPTDAGDRARFVRAHRKSVQRWLDDLAAAGLVMHEPESDQAGMWWRTQIVLLAAPEASASEPRDTVTGANTSTLTASAMTPEYATNNRQNRLTRRRDHGRGRRIEIPPFVLSALTVAIIRSWQTQPAARPSSPSAGRFCRPHVTFPCSHAH